MSEELEWQTLISIANAQTVRGIPLLRPLLPYANLGAVLAERVSRYGDKVFLIHYDETESRRQYTYREFDLITNQIANYLQYELRVRRSERIATIAHNHADAVLLYFGAWKIGATVAPQNVGEDDRRIEYILRNSQARVVFVREEYRERAERILKNVPNAREVTDLGDVRKLADTQPADFSPAAPPTRDDECLLVYTSGTTGAPKGVMLTQYNLMVNADSMARWDGWTPDDRTMCVLPVHHVNGIVVTHIAPLMAGASNVLNRQFSARHFWKRISAERVTVSSVVPTLLQFLLEANEDISQHDLSHLRYLICGAGTLSVALAQKFEERFGVKIIHGYGLSETTAYACHLPVDLPPEEHRRWLTAYGYPSIGCPLDVNEMAIFDAAGKGRALGVGERGEIAIRGHDIMQGYFQRPDANRETFKYGWFRSGDEGFYKTDAHGRKFFFITGRIKELINRGGVKFSPLDIEEVLLEIPGVRIGLAIAFENIYYGEEVGAYIVAESGVHLSESQVLNYCRKRLGFEKSPKVVVYGDDAPVTATGKYQRLLLKDKFAAWKEKQFRDTAKG